MVESIAGKGESAGFQQFLLFPQCFQGASFSGSLKVGIVWERVTVYSENSQAKDAAYQHFLLFQQWFQKSPTYGSLKM